MSIVYTGNDEYSTICNCERNSQAHIESDNVPMTHRWPVHSFQVAVLGLENFMAADGALPSSQ